MQPIRKPKKEAQESESEEEDTRNKAPRATFWNAMDSYLRPLTEDDIALIKPNV